MSNVSDLQPIAADAERPNTTRRSIKLPLQPPVCSAVWTSDESTYYQYQLNTKCQDFITRYLGRSLVSPDDPNLMHVNRKLLNLAFTVSAMTFMIQDQSA